MSTTRAISNFSKKARWAFFEEHGLLSEIDGLMLVVVRTDIRYRRAAVDGDILRFEGRLKELTSRHIILTQNIVLPSGKNAVASCCKSSGTAHLFSKILGKPTCGTLTLRFT